MAEPPAHPNYGDDAAVGPGRESPPSAPRWVKVFGIIAIVLVLVIIIVLLVGGGNHGPGRHASSGGGDTQAAAHIPPTGGHGP